MYLMIYVYVFISFLLYTKAEINFNKYIELDSDIVNKEVPGPYFPIKCNDTYMFKCARVSFDMCLEKKVECGPGEINDSSNGKFSRCKQMSQAFSDGNNRGMNVSMFFNN